MGARPYPAGVDSINHPPGTHEVAVRWHKRFHQFPLFFVARTILDIDIDIDSSTGLRSELKIIWDVCLHPIYSGAKFAHLLVYCWAYQLGSLTQGYFVVVLPRLPSCSARLSCYREKISAARSVVDREVKVCTHQIHRFLPNLGKIHISIDFHSREGDRIISRFARLTTDHRRDGDKKILSQHETVVSRSALGVKVLCVILHVM